MKTLFAKYDRRPAPPVSSLNRGEALVMSAVLAKIEEYDRRCAEQLASTVKASVYRWNQPVSK